MSLQQAKFIKKGSAGIEAVTLGQNPWFDERLVSQHIALPTCARPAFVSQNVLSTSLSSADATCPPGMAITIYEHLGHTALKVSRATSSGNLPNLLGAPRLDLSLARHNGDIVGHVAMKHARDAHAVITVPAESTDASSELQEPAARSGTPRATRGSCRRRTWGACSRSWSRRACWSTSTSHGWAPRSVWSASWCSSTAWSPWPRACRSWGSRWIAPSLGSGSPPLLPRCRCEAELGCAVASWAGKMRACIQAEN